MKFIINGELKPLGTVTHHFARVEFQNRGSPHYHIFFWIEGIPTSFNPSDTSKIKNYIQSTIHTHVPDINENKELHDLVVRLQTHSQKPYCMPSMRPPGRFGFPKHVLKQN